MALLRQQIPKLDSSEPFCANLIDHSDAPLWKGLQMPLWKGLQMSRRNFSLGHRLAGRYMVVMILLTLYHSSKFLLVSPGSHGAPRVLPM